MSPGIGQPDDVTGLTDRISTPAFATSVGLVRWGISRNEERVTEVARVSAREEQTSHGGVFRPVVGFGNWIKRALLPGGGE